MTPPQSPEAIELARLHEAATPGPWQSHGSHIYGPEREIVTQAFSVTGRVCDDRDLIVALRNNLPRILAALDLLATQEAMVNEVFGLETGDE